MPLGRLMSCPKADGKVPRNRRLSRFCPVPSEPPRMQRLFVDRQYSPSTGMGLSEWEIILEELTRMGYIVKKELNIDSTEWELHSSLL
jgi:hypothetical protein